MTILDYCISLNSVQNFLVVLGVVDMSMNGNRCTIGQICQKVYKKYHTLDVELTQLKFTYITVLK